jgi:predicted dehydrogenase
MGGEIVEVMQYATHGKGVDFSDYEYPPTTATLCKFADGRVGKVTSSIECIQPYVFNINLVGSRGTIRNNRIFSKTKFPGQSTWVEVPTILPDSGDVSHHPFTGEVAHLVACIRSGQESHVSVADAFKTHAVCFAADTSGRTGKPERVAER